MITIKGVKNLDLDNTITCGQIFRFNKEEDNSYTVILNDRVVNISYKRNSLCVWSNDETNLENIIRDYLDLDRDYISIIENIRNKDKILAKYLDNSIGLKIIKQNPLECIISYIISANNSVNNITNSLNLISKQCGRRVEFNGKEYFLFPTVDKLLMMGEKDFRNCKIGFRDKYLVEIIKSISNKELDIDSIYDMDTDTALKYLMSFKGIGMKVASCILLFAYQKFDVFPVDTWVKKFMESNYNVVGESNIRRFAKEKYQEYCGLAIQYMFNSMRNID